MVRAMAVVAMLVIGCATPFQPMGFRGGYEESRVGGNDYVVHVQVNGFTSQGRAIEYAYLRAGQICPAGYDVQDRAASSTSTYLATSRTTVAEMKKPEITLVVRCHVPEPQPRPATVVEGCGLTR